MGSRVPNSLPKAGSQALRRSTSSSAKLYTKTRESSIYNARALIAKMVSDSPGNV